MAKRAKRVPASSRVSMRVPKSDAKLGKLSSRDKASEYKRVPGDPARRYQKIGGRKLLSRRQHDALLDRESVKREQPKQFNRENTTRYWHMVRDWRAREAPNESKRAVSKNPQFKRELREFVTSEDNSPDGPRARFLVKLGWRDADAKYPVGATPKKRRR